MDIGYDNHQENDGGNHWFFFVQKWRDEIFGFCDFFVCLSNSSVSQKVLTTLFFFSTFKGDILKKGNIFLNQS